MKSVHVSLHVNAITMPPPSRLQTADAVDNDEDATT